MAGFTLDALRDKHSLANSQFGTFAGVPTHYVIEGSGPPLVLLHGSFLDLTSWESWVAVLRSDFQILRFDRLRFGLTGHANDGPIDYADEGALLEAFVDALGLQKFALAGTSSGGMVAARYAAMHPERVSQLILMNFPIGHDRIKQAGEDVDKPAARPSPRAMIREVIRRNMVDPSEVSEAMLERLCDFAEREDPAGAAAGAWKQAGSFPESERRALLARIKAPTLVLWSEFNKTLPVENGAMALEAVGAAEKHLLVVKDAGHMHPLEKGAESARQVQAFLKGQFVPVLEGA